MEITYCRKIGSIGKCLLKRDEEFEIYEIAIKL
jgi:hypothetical protein